MLYFSKTRILLISLFTLIFVYLTLSNFIKTENNWHDKKINLGLDLQGGSHLLLAADTNALFEKQLNSFSSDLLSELRSQNVRYTKTSHSLIHKDSRSGSVVFTLRSADDARKVKDTAYQISAQPNGSSALDVEIKQSTVTLTLNELYTCLLYTSPSPRD